MLEGPRRAAVIAWTEARRTGASFNATTLVLMLVLGGATGFLASEAATAFDFDHGLYRVAARPDSILLPAVEAAPQFQVTMADDPLPLLADGRADVALLGSQIVAVEGDKGAAAVDALRDAAREYTYRAMASEEDEAAAFPVRVEVVYQEQPRRPLGATEETGGSPSLPGSGTGSGTGTETGGGGSGTGTGTGGGGDTSAVPPASEATGGGAGGFAFLPPERSINTPETLAPPFPFRSLILAYLFLVPMNFVVQVYAGSVIAERIGRKGESLLASPARTWEIVAGKAFPYLLLMVLVSAGVAVWIGAGWRSVVAVSSLALAFLGLEFVAAMFARSFRELTFLTVFTSVLLTIYAFLPAVFSDVHPIALISPITIVVLELRGEIPSLAQFLYATLPLTLLALHLFVLGSALHREEDLFHQKPVHKKALDALARQVRGVASGFKLSVLLLPAVFVAELLLVAFLFAWPVPVGLLGILFAVALVEETFKGAPSYAAIARGTIPVHRALLFGLLTGVGFFVAEKAFLLASLAGLLDVSAGAAVFGAAAPAAEVSGWLVAALLAAPLVLHAATATLSAWGARQGKTSFLLAFSSAVLLHTVYNWTIVVALGGWSP